MNLVSSLIKNSDQFTIDDFNNDMPAYERAYKSLLKNDPATAYKCLKHYYEEFKKIEKEPFLSYRPGMDYRCSFYSLYQYTLLEKNKKDRDYAYLLLLKRFAALSLNVQKDVIKHKHLLLRYAYPDLNDLYSPSLYDVGNYLYQRKRYKEAFRFFKKGADFSDNGRQIEYPFFLMAMNQDKVGDMYYYGQGVKKNYSLAKRYYRKAAYNCGREHHPKMGNFEYMKGNYTKAFMYYTSGYGCYSRYNVWFLEPYDIDDKYEVIFNKLSSIPEDKRDTFTNVALSIMYYYGYGCDVDTEKSKSLLPLSERDWVMHKYALIY